jgi:nitroimidazol reductase NimA-like FMN-containing flavoprotein (pyridoxamine 5'-phosphate oxidase superfamily)
VQTGAMNAREPLVGRPSMTSYGVPDDPAGALPWSWAEERLTSCRNYWVVTATLAGRPHAMPVWGVWRPDSTTFVFSCAPDARKARNIAENPQVCVMVEDTVECVSVEGIARSLDEDGARIEAATAYAEKYAPPDERESMQAFVLGHAMFEVDPSRAFGIIEREVEFATKATRWTW